MCGVVSIVYGKPNKELGKEGAALLKRLEYRGYDSTGAAFFNQDGSVVLKKKVGAPSVVIQEMELEKQCGYKFIGQVRWATYGAVTEANAQPHEMNCRVHIVGAHNGNISNTDTLKEYLVEHRHNILSDNDGEMLTHVIEHYYSYFLEENQSLSTTEKVQAFIQAIRKAHQKVQGSYAACITTPDIPGVFAMKAGSSLYAGKGSDGNGEFIVVSSDLTSVLSKTRFLIPLAEGEALYFTNEEYQVYALDRDESSHPDLARSKLNIADITLQSKYSYFMHQEIYSAADNLGSLVQYYFPDHKEEEYFRIFESKKEECNSLVFEFLKLNEIFEPEMLQQSVHALLASAEFEDVYQKFCEQWSAPPGEIPFTHFRSDEAPFLRELREFGAEFQEKLLLLDFIIVWKKKRKIIHYRDRLIKALTRNGSSNNKIFIVGAGTSYHAALVAGYFFNNVGQVSVIPANPGLFRSVFMNGLRAGDLLIGVTQSGETKDLLDIFNEIRALYGDAIQLVSVVNNENSTIPQEKSDYFLPILCGPEIAVAATKSFISQIALFYTLALCLKMDGDQVQKHLKQIQYVLNFTVSNAIDELTEVSLRFYLKPSIHILGTSLLGLAKEGALKIREIVLNHTEGYDAAEFKHGPNTILGRNTLYSLTDMEHLFEDMCDFFKDLDQNESQSEPLTKQTCLDMLKVLRFKEFKSDLSANGLTEDEVRSFVGQCYRVLREHVHIENYFSNYPLIFICPPDERDKRITISQIHTHKIRGADVVLIAQDDEDLRKAIEGKPSSIESYYSKYIKIPKMFDANTFVFGAAVVLQLLAFKMSVAKMKYLNRIQVEQHGVHPDVPKNVSKSITVD